MAKSNKLTLSHKETGVKNIDNLINILPEQTGALVVWTTEPKIVFDKPIKGFVHILNTTVDTRAEFTKTDAEITMKFPVEEDWNLEESFPSLPTNYAGNGEFKSSFLYQLSFSSATLVLTTKAEKGYRKGANFLGEINVQNSPPVSWMKFLGVDKKWAFKGYIDTSENHIELANDISINKNINKYVKIKQLKMSLFSNLVEDNKKDKDGIKLEGILALTGHDDTGKQLKISSIIDPHNRQYLMLEARSGQKALSLDDIIKVFTGKKLNLIPDRFVQPKLNSIRIAINKAAGSSIDYFQLGLSTGKWQMFAGNEKFSVEDILLDVQSHYPTNNIKREIEVKIQGNLKISDANLAIYGEYPSYIIHGFLVGQSTIDVKKFIDYVGGVAPEELVSFKITNLDLLANPTKNTYSFDLAIAGEWQLKDTNLKLRQLRAAFKYEKTGATAKKDFLIFGDLQINDNLVVAAGYKKEGDDWSIIGHLEYGKQVTLKQLDTSADNHVPSALTSDSFAIEYLTAAYTTKEKGLLKVSAHAVLPFTIDGKKHNLDVAILLQRKAGKDDPDSGYTGYLKSKYNYDNKLPLALNIEVKPGKKVKEKSLVFGLEEGKTTTLPALVEFLVNKEAAEVVPDLKISALQFAIDNDNLEVTIKIGESKAKDKKKSDKEKKTKTAKKITDKKPVKLSKSKEDKSDLGLSYIYFHYKRTKKAGKVTNSELQFSIEASGKFNDDVHFNLMALDYKYDFKKEEEKPATEGEKKPKKDKPQKLETKWSITGTVDVKAFGKDKLKMTSSYEKTAVVEEKKTVVKNKLKLKADSSKKDPIIDTKSFKMKSLEVILELKDTQKNKK